MDIDIVLGALLGARTADKEVSKGGFKKRLRRLNKKTEGFIRIRRINNSLNSSDDFTM